MSEEAEVTISYLILCHDSPDRIVRLVTRILSDDETGQVVIHFDKNSSRAKFNELKTRLHDTSRCHVVEQRVRCGWGQWSLVEATFKCLIHAFTHNKSSYFYLLSEYCYPIKKLDDFKCFLKGRDISFLECKDESWIKGGIRTDRYRCYHFTNKRKNPRTHRYIYKIQKKIGLKRNIPKELDFRFGSQWWCLKDSDVPIFINTYYKYKEFFRFVWIPDELFFSTIAKSYKVICQNKSLTLNKFDKDGRPLLFGIEELNSIDNHGVDDIFFVRKVL